MNYLRRSSEEKEELRLKIESLMKEKGLSATAACKELGYRKQMYYDLQRKASRLKSAAQLVTVPIPEKKEVKILIGDPDDIKQILNKLGY